MTSKPHIRGSIVCALIIFGIFCGKVKVTQIITAAAVAQKE
jgi:hypothetical protein